MAATPDELKRKVAYFYKPSIGDYSYGDNHFMKPERIRLTDNYVQKHNLYKGMEIVKDYPVAEEKDILKFHSKDYVDFLKSVAPSLIMKEEDKNKFGIDADCPAFDGVYAFSQLSAGGSIAAASFLNNQRADIAINWSGGLHHAKMTRASGFCFVNDIVLGILELLKFYPRVLYVDIDMHHGDGVEEAFYCTNRVMTVSFHKYGEGFFPESGHYEDIGHDSGRGYSLNVPLHSGIDDDSFVALFQPVMQKVMDVYQPNAVVLQCGADSLIGDPIGKFNLSIKGHAYCLKFFRAFNVPLLILGGGGYMPENVAKCWCYETSLAAGIDIDIDDPSLSLAFEKRNPNKNHEKDLNDMRELLIDRVSKLSYAPSVQFMDVDVSLRKVPEEGEVPMDTRPKARISMPKDDEE